MKGGRRARAQLGEPDSCCQGASGRLDSSSPDLFARPNREQWPGAFFFISRPRISVTHRRHPVNGEGLRRSDEIQTQILCPPAEFRHFARHESVELVEDLLQGPFGLLHCYPLGLGGGIPRGLQR